MVILTYEANDGSPAHLFEGVFDTPFEAAKSVQMHDKGWLLYGTMPSQVEPIYKGILNVLGKLPKSAQFHNVYNDDDIRTGIYYIWEF